MREIERSREQEIERSRERERERQREREWERERYRESGLERERERERESERERRESKREGEIPYVVIFIFSAKLRFSSCFLFLTFLKRNSVLVQNRATN